MRRLVTLMLVVLALLLSASPQQPVKVSPEFAKAANLALVAVKNSDNTSLLPDKLVKEAINNADAPAISDTETAVLSE